MLPVRASANPHFVERNQPHLAFVPQVIHRWDQLGVDATESGAELLGGDLLQLVRARGRDSRGAEWRYWPDLACRGRRSRLKFYCECKASYRSDTGNCSLEWDAYQAYMALADAGLRIAIIFDHWQMCWMQDLEFCSPVRPGVAPGRTDYRLVPGHGPFLRPIEVFARVELGSSLL